MLAGCSSSGLLSPRHRLTSEASAQFQACHFPSMSTQKLDLPSNFTRKNTSIPQPIRPVGVSIEKPTNPKTSNCSLKQKRETQDQFFEKGKSLKRFAEEDNGSQIQAKRKRGIPKSEDCFQFEENLSLSQLGSGNCWFQPSFEVPKSFSLISGLNTPQIPFSISSSGDDLIAPPLGPSNPFVNSIITEITELGDRSTETRYTGVQEPSGSSSSSERDSHSFSLRFNENPLGHEIGNGSGQAVNPGQGANFAATHNPNHDQEDGFELISLLVACVDAIGSKNISGVNHFIAKLGDLASPKGSPISRLIAYFTEALAMRVTKIWPFVFHLVPPHAFDREDDNGGAALRLFNQISPIPKFIHFTSNEIILRAFEGKDKVHIIDFDVKQGLQWPSLFQSLAMRDNPPSHVRITGIGESKQDLIETGDRLAAFAEALNLPFKFHPVVDRLEDVRLWMLHVKERETVAINCIFQLHKLLYDGNGGALRDFLGLIRSTNPSVTVLAEQEANHNEVNLEMRLSNSLKYYSSIFDSIDSTSLGLDSPVRMKIEEIFGQEIRNIIACEGSDRVERHEKFEKWRRFMEHGGFRGVAISERELIQSKMILKMFSFENFRVEKKRGENGEWITMNWLDQPLYTVSAWKLIGNNIGESSSSFFS